MAKLQVMTNVPIRCRMKYADLVDGQFGDQVRVKTEGGDVCYLPDAVVEPMVRDGLLKTNGEDQETGKTRLVVLYKGEVEILRSEEGKKKVTTVRKVAAGQVTGTPGATPSGANEATTGETSRDVRAHIGGGLVWGADPWRELGNRYAKAVAIARRVWGEVDPAVLQSAAATILIAADKAGLPHPQAPTAAPSAKEGAA